MSAGKGQNVADAGDGKDFVGLSEVIRQVRSELEAARTDGEGHDLRFSVDKVSLEFAIQVRRAGSGKGGLRIGVVTAELSGESSKDTTHRVQVDLRPEHGFRVSRDGAGGDGLSRSR